MKQIIGAQSAKEVSIAHKAKLYSKVKVLFAY